jgi:hypothetical protein
MKYAADNEMGSGAMIYVSNFIKIGSGIQKFLGEGFHGHVAWISLKPTLGKWAKNTFSKFWC